MLPKPDVVSVDCRPVAWDAPGSLLAIAEDGVADASGAEFCKVTIASTSANIAEV
jgi:hypothetical protein